jgi:H2-forming N5,N10-methylenetetrahydromethanopterin dehydrogenase-like enzyme
MEPIMNVNMVEATMIIIRDKPCEVWWSKEDAIKRCIELDKQTGENTYTIPISVQDPASYIAHLIGENDVDKFENIVCYDPIGQIVIGSIGLEPLGMIRTAERFANNEIKIVFLDEGKCQEKTLSEMP